MRPRAKRVVLSNFNGRSVLVWLPTSVFLLFVAGITAIPAVWLAALARRLALGPSTTAFVASVSVVWVAVAFGVLAFQHARTCGAVWLHPRGLVLRRYGHRRGTRRGHRLERVPLRAVGHVGLGAKRGLVLGMDLHPRSVRIPLSRFCSEDDFALLLEHLAQHAPDHLYSIDEPGERRYSRDWALAELLPGHPPADSFVATPLPGRPRRWSIDAGDAQWTFHGGTGHLQRVGAEHAVLAAHGKRLLVHRAGTIVANVREDGPGVLEVGFGCGEAITVDLPRAVVAVDGRAAGTLRLADGGAILHFSDPMPAVLGLAATAVVLRAGSIG